MRVIFTIHTYFQLLIVMNMKQQFFINDQVDIVISDVSNGSKKVVDRLRETKFFHECYYTRVKEWISVEGTINKFKKFLKADLHYENIVKENIDINKQKYDLFVFCQLDPWTDALYFTLKKYNPDIECRRMQETFNSYLNEGGLIVYSEKTEKIKNLMRRLTFNPIIRREMTQYYFFDPEMIIYKPTGKYKIVKMERFNSDDKQFLDAINYVFDYPALKDEYKEKYIYFESIEHNEFEVIQLLASIVGKENFIVKIHPRSKSDKYSAVGIKTNKDLSIPWEVILLNKNFDGHVFITATSQAVFGFLQFTNQNAQGVLTYKCLNAKIDKALDVYLKKMQSKYGNNKLIIPHSVENLISLLKEN